MGSSVIFGCVCMNFMLLCLFLWECIEIFKVICKKYHISVSEIRMPLYNMDKLLATGFLI